MISGRILYLFLLEYGKTHLIRAFFSLLGIALGVALFVNTTFNGRRAEKSLIDFSSGYYGNDYSLKIYHNNGAIGIEDDLIYKIFYYPEFRWIRSISPRVKKILNWKKGEENVKIIYQAVDYLKESKKIFSSEKQNPFSGSESYLYMSTSLKEKGFGNQEIVYYKNIPMEFQNPKEISSEGGIFLLEDISTYKTRFPNENYSFLLIETDSFKENDLQQLRTFLHTISPGLQVETKEEILQRASGALKSFHLNLIIISMISVIIAFFMVSNTMTGIYLTRKKELGVLRCIGTTPIQNLILFLSQGILLGLIGTISGIFLGYMFSKFAFFSGESTVTDKSQAMSYTDIPLDILLWSVLIGIMGSIISTLVPSIRSFYISPLTIVRGTEEKKKINGENVLFALGIILLLISFPIASIKLGTSLPIMGLISIGLIILAQTIQFPFLFQTIVFVVRKVLSLFDKSFVNIRIGIEELFANNLKNTLTAGTLMLAVSLVISLSMLTESYEHSIVSWTEREFPYPDSLVNLKDIEEGTANGIPLSYYKTLQKFPNIAEVDVFYINTRVEIGRKIFTIHSYDFSLARKREKESGVNTYPPEQENGILISANMSYLHGYKIGDRISIPTKIGNQEFVILGIREHFFSESGTIMMDSVMYEKFFQPEEYHALRILYKDPSLREKTLSDLQKLIQESEDLKLLSADELKEIYIQGTRKVFKVLDSLKWTASVIALISLFSSILYGLDDKLRIFSMIRSMGAGIEQIGGIIWTETFFLCFSGVIAGILSSLFLSPIILDVINKNAFGWSLQMVLPTRIIFLFLLSIFPVSLLVCIYPIWIMKRLSLREILSYE